MKCLCLQTDVVITFSKAFLLKLSLSNILAVHVYMYSVNSLTCYDFFLILSVVAPYNVTIMGETLHSQGEQLQLSCLSGGGPVLEYSWLFSGDTIPNANTSTLTIDNVNTTHAGDYTCNVTNNAGYQSNTVTVYSKLCTVCV